MASGIKRPTTSQGVASSANKPGLKKPSGLAAPTPTKTGGLKAPSKLADNKKPVAPPKIEESKDTSSFSK